MIKSVAVQWLFILAMRLVSVSIDYHYAALGRCAQPVQCIPTRNEKDASIHGTCVGQLSGIWILMGIPPRDWCALQLPAQAAGLIVMLHPA